MKIKNAHITFIVILIGVQLACLNSSTKMAVTFPLSPKWVFPVGDEIYSVASSSQGIAIAKPSGIVLIDADTGSLIWEHPYSVEPQSKLYFSDELLIAQNSSQISVIDTNGAELKVIELKRNFGETTNIITVLSKYAFIVRTPAWRLEAYNLDDGTLAWSDGVGRGIKNINYDAMSDTLYVASLNFIRAYDLESGKLHWEISQWASTSIYDSGSLFYYGKADSQGAYFFARYDVSTLNLKWTLNFSPLIQTDVYNLTIADNTLIAGTTYGLIAIDKSKGTQLWNSKIDEIYTKPIVIDNVIYVKSSASKTVYAISISDGQMLGKLQLEPPPSVVVLQPSYKYALGLLGSNGNLIITTSNTIYSYGNNDN
jgi:outer membrane protein assembly factor BamB